MSGVTTLDRAPTRAEPLPVSVLVGFLGSGKTTLLNHLLAENHGRKIAVVVNDFAELNIDSRLVKHVEAEMIEMSNGCICCTLRADLLREVRRLAQLPGIDYLLIESTGIGEPLPIAQTFFMEDLPDLARLDSIVTVVDAAAFWHDFGRTDLIEDDEGNPVESPLAPLLLDQIEFTNVLLLNKVDLASPDDLARLDAFVRQLNPDAVVHQTVRGEIDPSVLIDTHLFSYDDAETAEGWDEEWDKDGSESEEYGFHTFVYRTETPLVWEPFNAIFSEWPEEILRVKGFVRFVDHVPVILSVAGSAAEMIGLEPPSSEELAEADSLDDFFLPDEDEPTELVFIGRGMPVPEIQRLLDRCLANEEAG
jgi:G3E family GTPase